MFFNRLELLNKDKKSEVPNSLAYKLRGERLGLTIRSMVLGCGFESRLLLKLDGNNENPSRQLKKYLKIQYKDVQLIYKKQ